MSGVNLNDKLLTDTVNESYTDNCSNIKQSPFWNIFLLALAWALTLTTSTLLTSAGPLAATEELDASDTIAAFTVGAFLIGAAVSSIPSGYIFRNYGRRNGFSIGCLFQLIGSISGGLAMLSKVQVFLYLGCFSVGMAQGLGQFYRFTAIEVSPAHLKSRAITYVLSGGIIAAFLGPTSANYSKNMFSQSYLGCFVIMAIIAFMNQVIVLNVNFPVDNERNLRITAVSRTSNPIILNPTKPLLTTTNNNNNKEAEEEEEEMNNTIKNNNSHTTTTKEWEDADEGLRIRSRYEIISQPMFMVSCTVATLAHTIMIMIMSNVSLAMDNSGYDFQNCTLVLELHFLGMFGPGFFSGYLIARYGSLIVALVAAFIFASSSFVLASGEEFWNYAIGMTLSGVGWNFAFSAGTVMLTSCYNPLEATEVQGINDFILFSVAGAGSLLSGFIYAQWGWLVLIFIVSGLMALYLGLFLIMWKYAPKDAEMIGDDNDDNIDDITSHSHKGMLSNNSNNHNNTTNISYDQSVTRNYSTYKNSIDSIKLRASFS